MAKNIDKLLENAFLSEQAKENKQILANLEIMSQQAKFSNHIQSQYYSSVFT